MKLKEVFTDIVQQGIGILITRFSALQYSVSRFQESCATGLDTYKTATCFILFHYTIK